MASVEKVSVALTTKQISSLRNAVEAGEYASTSEIVREALRDWEFKREARLEEINRLRQAWEEGIASGPSRKTDLEKLREEGRRRLAAIKAAL
ncbi:type II toxin-antitoxin system ParD family antitoxin [Labrys sp. LIt4]|uniref:Type II toxin-antitoxin system ParD family antitoxin n=1 Tax=Labrys okinawensis TaxID=346911 RepID=A0A2S9QFY0_9HYPH|nr:MULTISPECIES: type II toxin-antitoxin system ParD family antitoxin [Labrys]MBP0577958.1 type II toxin-antitoxin system ParD family antitoxin [Labrys sp. LIt4]PRH88276.1 type II toxin-antitoxin system ParD family antitoxin [Labrys okinawensis]